MSKQPSKTKSILSNTVSYAAAAAKNKTNNANAAAAVNTATANAIASDGVGVGASSSVKKVGGGKRSKAFLNKKTATTLHLVHRSQHDPLASSEHSSDQNISQVLFRPSQVRTQRTHVPPIDSLIDSFDRSFPV